MKINFTTNNVINIYKNNRTVQNSNTTKSYKADTIEISNVSKEIAKYLSVAKDYEIINEKVDRIKDQIKNSKYDVDTDKIAKSILKELKGCE